MKNIIMYIHPVRTYLPCTGVGRHINHMALGLNDQPEICIELLFSKQWLGSDNKLDALCPLRELPYRTFATNENLTERSWKLFGLPKLERYLASDTDWLYAPMETYLPVSKCPVVITLHDIQAFETELPWSSTRQHRWFERKYQRWVGRALKECRLIFTVSEFSKQRLVTLAGAIPDKVIVVGNGVEQAYFDIASADPHALVVSVDRPYILVIGGLRYKKGADYVLAVAKELQKVNTDLQIVVAGESEDEYIQAAREHTNISLLGMVADAELPRLIRCASSLLFLSHYEGFGIPALEAMAAGTPAVVANRASLPEIVGKAGIVVEPEKTQEIVDILINLHRDSALRDKYSRLGQIHAAQYTWSHCVERAVNAFEKFA